MSKDSERFRVRLDDGVVTPEDARVSVLTATSPGCEVAGQARPPHRRSTGTPRDTQAL